MYINLKRKEPLVYLDKRLWEYLLHEDVKNFLNTLDRDSYVVHRFTQDITIELKNDDDALMFKLLFGEYL